MAWLEMDKVSLFPSPASTKSFTTVLARMDMKPIGLDSWFNLGKIYLYGRPHRNKIIIYDLKMNVRFTLTPKWDRSPNSLVVSPYPC